MGSFKVDSIEIEWLGHAAFKIIFMDKVIYIDPYFLPKREDKADFILITHEHFDHCSEENVRKLIKPSGVIVASEDCAKLFTGLNVKTMKPNEKIGFGDVEIEAVYAYNVNKFRSPGQPFHEKGRKLGFILSLKGVKIYHAGDTDFIPEMKNISGIDVALLPIGGYYTMTYKEAAEATNQIRPVTVVPMHYNTFDNIKANPEDFSNLVDKSIEVKVLE